MTTPDHGVDLLLRRATDDLRPDVDQLVARGITRGRTRQRRARIGTAVAAVAVCGVFGASAAVVPHLGADPEAQRPAPPVATEPQSPTPRPEAPLPSITNPTGRIAAEPDAVPGLVEQVLGRRGAGPITFADEGSPVTDDDQLVVHFLWEGTMTSVVITPGRAEDNCGEGGTTCTTMDGSVQSVWGPTTADLVTAQGATVWRDGFRMDVLSYNAVEGKDVPPVLDAPPLSHADLLAVARSTVWFA